MVAPPTSTTASPPGSIGPISSTAARTMSGVAPCTSRAKSWPVLRPLPPITCDRNSARTAALAWSGAYLPICGHQVGDEHVLDPGRGEDVTDRTGRVGVPGDHDRGRAPAVGEHPGGREDAGRVAAVGSAGQQHQIGAGPYELGPALDGQRSGDGADHLSAAGQGGPPTRLAGDRQLVANHRDPQPTTGARAGQHRHPGRREATAIELGPTGLHTVEDVGARGGRVRRGRDLTTGVEIDQPDLGVGGPDVHAQHQVAAGCGLGHTAPYRRSAVEARATVSR